MKRERGNISVAEGQLLYCILLHMFLLSGFGIEVPLFWQLVLFIQYIPIAFYLCVGVLFFFFVFPGGLYWLYSCCIIYFIVFQGWVYGVSRVLTSSL